MSKLKSIVNISLVVITIIYVNDIAKQHDYDIYKFADSYDKEHKLGKYSDKTKSQTIEKIEVEKPKNIVYVHGLEDYDNHDLQTICRGIENFWGFETKIGDSHVNLPSSYFVNGEKINALKSLDFAESDVYGRHVYVTNHPICVSENEPKTISGYGRYYYNGLIVSTYQLKMNNNYNTSNLQNVTNHEIGHNFGLEHCDNNECLMKLGVITNKNFCNKCKNNLKNEQF